MDKIDRGINSIDLSNKGKYWPNWKFNGPKTKNIRCELYFYLRDYGIKACTAPNGCDRCYKKLLNCGNPYTLCPYYNESIKILASKLIDI